MLCILSFIFWHETCLSLLAWSEALFLGTAWILLRIGHASVRRNPDDYVYHFARLWWSTFRQKPSPISKPKMVDVDSDDEKTAPLMDLIDEDAIEALGEPAKEPSRQQDSDSDSDDSEESEAGGGMRLANLSVRIIPSSAADEIVGFQGRTLRIRLTANPDGGQANKALIELLCSTLNLRPHQVQLKRGHYEDVKAIQIAGMAQDELDDRLAAFS